MACRHTRGATSRRDNAFLVTLARFGMLAGHDAPSTGRSRCSYCRRGVGGSPACSARCGAASSTSPSIGSGCTNRWCGRARAARAARRRSPGTTTCPSSVGCCSAESVVTAACRSRGAIRSSSCCRLLLALAVYARFVAGVDAPRAVRLAAHFLVYFAFVGTLVVLAGVDLDHKIIPDVVTYPAIPAFFVAGILLRDVAPLDLILGMAAGYGIVAVTAELAYLDSRPRGHRLRRRQAAHARRRALRLARGRLHVPALAVLRPRRSRCRSSSPSAARCAASRCPTARSSSPRRSSTSSSAATLWLRYFRRSAASTKCSRSLPQWSSSPTNMVGAPNAPRAIASSVLARSLSLTAGLSIAASRVATSSPPTLGDAPQLRVVGDVAILGPHRRGTPPAPPRPPARRRRARAASP